MRSFNVQITDHITSHHITAQITGEVKSRVRVKSLHFSLRLSTLVSPTVVSMSYVCSFRNNCADLTALFPSCAPGNPPTHQPLTLPTDRDKHDRQQLSLLAWLIDLRVVLSTTTRALMPWSDQTHQHIGADQNPDPWALLMDIQSALHVQSIPSIVLFATHHLVSGFSIDSLFLPINQVFDRPPRYCPRQLLVGLPAHVHAARGEERCVHRTPSTQDSKVQAQSTVRVK
jgi:hypothetical protein